MLRHALPKFPAEVLAARNTTASLVYYQTKRTKMAYTNRARFHMHETYSKIGKNTTRVEIVNPKFLKRGEPVTPSLNFGDMVAARKFKFNTESLNARGFLRFQKSYTPPADAAEKVLEICRSCLNSNSGNNELMNTEISDSKVKYEILTKTFEHFQHGIPNSMLHMMRIVGDIVDFYCTRVNMQTPYESLIRNPDLPPNLHIQKEPLRFHPDTDTMFGGVSAFTKSSTMVTGLKAKKKYRGYEAKMTWP